MTALELIKANSRGAQSLVLIIDSAEAQRIVSAWPMIPHTPIDRTLKKKETFEDVAIDLWGKAHASFSMEDLANQADVPVTHCERIFFRLIRAGIVYPDGTISKVASDFLDGRVMANIRGLIPKGKR